MECTVKSYGALCSLEVFTINGIRASEEDFVDKYDHDPAEAEDYGCGNMQADIIEPSDAVLTKYGITIDEYYEIAEKVVEEVSFGCCGWCV